MSSDSISSEGLEATDIKAVSALDFPRIAGNT